MTLADIKRPVRLVGPVQRAHAKALVDMAPPDWIVTIKAPTRSLEQNAKLHAMLRDIARAKPMGWNKDIETWKAIMLRSLGHEIRFEFDIYGNAFPLGLKTSKLSVKRIGELIEFMYAFGAEQGITWSETYEDQGG